MKRSFVKIYCGVIAVAIIATAATNAWAYTSGNLLANGNVELESRFTPHGTPGVQTPNGVPDGWHHSSAADGDSGWNPALDGMYTSGVHSLYHRDDEVASHEENRSFVEDLGTGYNVVSGKIPGGAGPRSLWVSWKWKWNKELGDLFGATLRTSTGPVNNSLNLAEPPGGVRDHVYYTDGTVDSGGFQMVMSMIPLLANEQTFDITFRTRDSIDDDPLTEGIQNDGSELGIMWVDDVEVLYHVPEPATMALLGLGGLGLMMVSRRRRG